MLGAGQGYLNFVDQDQRRRQGDMVLQQMLEQQQARQRALAARGPAGAMLYQMFGGQQGPQDVPPPPMAGPGGMAPPPAGTPQGGPMPPPPGANPAPQGIPPQQRAGVPPPNPGMMPPPPMAAAGGPPGGAPMGAPAPAAPPPQVQPFRPLPPPAASMGAGGPGQIAPPPAEAPAGPGLSDPGKQFNLGALIKQLQTSGVPPDKVMDMLDQLGPVMTAQNKQELEFFKAHNTALKQANETYTRLMNAMAAQQRAETGVKAEERKSEQGNRRLDILQRRAQAAAGGAGNLKKVEVLYPKDASGKVDQTKEPVGTRSITKSGKIIYLDADGLQSTAAALAGGTASEDKASRVGVTNIVRQNIVKAGVKNSLRLLDEIEKEYPKENTSVFFGTHAENPVSKSLYGAGRGAMSSRAKQVDAKWAGFIDEAIPVFTGGLRGSDAFRRFLIEQAPGPGDDEASRAVKVRTIRENIKGTNRAFFNKFADDSTMWATGTKPEEVEEAKQELSTPVTPTAPKGPKAPAAPGGWKVEKVTP